MQAMINDHKLNVLYIYICNYLLYLNNNIHKCMDSIHNILFYDVTKLPTNMEKIVSFINYKHSAFYANTYI